jgi:hypothetical protein
MTLKPELDARVQAKLKFFSMPMVAEAEELALEIAEHGDSQLATWILQENDELAWLTVQALYEVLLGREEWKFMQERHGLRERVLLVTRVVVEYELIANKRTLDRFVVEESIRNEAKMAAVEADEFEGDTEEYARLGEDLYTSFDACKLSRETYNDWREHYINMWMSVFESQMNSIDKQALVILAFVGRLAVDYGVGY